MFRETPPLLILIPLYAHQSETQECDGGDDHHHVDGDVDSDGDGHGHHYEGDGGGGGDCDAYIL